MDAIIEIIRNLVFGAIAISVIEIVVPDNSLKKYFNYTGGLVFLAIMAGSFYNLYTDRDNVVNSFKFQKEVMENMEKTDRRFNQDIEKDKKSFFEKSLKDSIDMAIIDFIETRYKKNGVKVESEVFIPQDIQRIEIKELTLGGIQKEELDEEFYKYIKENFNLEKNSIIIKSEKR